MMTTPFTLRTSVTLTVRGDWPVFSEVVEYRRAVVVDLYDADAPSDVSFAQWLRAFEDQGAIGVGYRVPVRIPRRMT
jgi:hypothetical protein